MKSSAAQLAALEPYKWQPGESANPAGRPKGSRHKLQEAVVKALYTDFVEHGPAAIVKVRERKPEVYLMACVALLPKQAQKIESPFQDVSDRELDMLEQHLAAIRAKLVADIEATAKTTSNHGHKSDNGSKPEDGSKTASEPFVQPDRPVPEEQERQRSALNVLELEATELPATDAAVKD